MVGKPTISHCPVWWSLSLDAIETTRYRSKAIGWYTHTVMSLICPSVGDSVTEAALRAFVEIALPSLMPMILHIIANADFIQEEYKPLLTHLSPNPSPVQLQVLWQAIAFKVFDYGKWIQRVQLDEWPIIIGELRACGSKTITKNMQKIRQFLTLYLGTIVWLGKPVEVAWKHLLQSVLSVSTPKQPLKMMAMKALTPLPTTTNCSH